MSYNLCYLSVLAYCKEDSLEDWSCRDCACAPMELEDVTVFKTKLFNGMGYMAFYSSSPKMYFPIGLYFKLISYLLCFLCKK
jgi:hypothetical protein